MKKILFPALIIFLALVLRLYDLGSIPPSLNWDEASLGYNAYAISQTLRDEHGEFLPIARFIAFGDYKPPGYIYLDALFVKILGLSEFSVRLPSALAGALLVMVSYYLTRELLYLDGGKSMARGRNKYLPALAALFLAISPWALQFSRGAFEANLATLFSGLGIYLFLRTIRTRGWLSCLLSGIFFALSMYTFNSHRVFVPLMIAALLLIFYRNIWSNRRQFIVFGTVTALLLLPMLPHIFSREGRLRFYEVTWLNDLKPIELSNARITQDGDTWWSKILHNRRVVYTWEFLQHYTDHFRGDFLFYHGDVNPRLSVQSVGELYWADLLLIIPGIYYLLRRRSKATGVIFAWLLIAPIPAAVARETPHALRILPVLPIWSVIAAWGLAAIWEIAGSSRFQRALGLTVAVIYALSLLVYLRDYYFTYPEKYALDWQYGYKEAVAYVAAHADEYDHISVSEAYGRPYIFFLFYEQYPPEKYWATRSADRDWYGFWYVHGFAKLLFGTTSGDNGRWLYLREPGATPKDAKLLKTISAPDGRSIWEISAKT